MLARLFQLDRHNTTARREMIAGVTTFLTAAYIIFVNPSILALTGMDKGALTTVTCLAAALATLLAAFWANAPVMMAPGMGLNAFFTYTLVLQENVPWQTALGVVFLSGTFFLLLTLLGVRERLAYAIPVSLRIATSAGIGLFIAFIGLQNLGLITRNDTVLVQLGTFTPAALLGLFGLLLSVILVARQVRGALLLSILSTSVLGLLLNQAPMPQGVVALPPSPAPIAFHLDIPGALEISLWASIFSFMFVDLFDSLGTILAVCRAADMADERGVVHVLPRLLTADALATMGGALLGTSTTTAYIESATGTAEGGRTGLTAATTAVLFLVACFFTPLIAAVPSFATAPALVIVGIFMMRGIGHIDFEHFEEGVPAFLTFLLMPLTYSIATGLAFGFLSYVLIRLLLGRITECNLFLLLAAAFSLISLAV